MKVLAIGAHFDDVEIGCGGALLKHRNRGDKIHVIVVTHSGYESETKQFSRSRQQARREGENSARLLNAHLVCCDKEPLVMTPTEQLVLELESMVNDIKPDRIYTHQSTDCHADHAAVGYVSTRACRKCDEVFLYRSNWYIMESSRDDNYYVDISEHIDEKMGLMSLFESEMVTVNYSWLDFVRRQNGAAGAKVNVSYAETFQVMKMFWK